MVRMLDVSLAVIKHHNQSNPEESKLVSLTVPEGEPITAGEAQQQRDHIFTHEAESGLE